jgi:hypothetical protein
VTTEDETAAASVVRRAVGGDADASAACPDPNLLAGFAERSLAESETRAVAAHASGCAACRETLAELAEAGIGGETRVAASSGPSLPAGARLRALGRPRAYGVAALVLLACGAALWAFGRRGTEPADTDERLVAAARDLATSHSDLFGGFSPIGPDERAREVGSRERGGLRLLSPAEVVLSTRPAFAWVAVRGIAEYEVRLEREDGATLFTRTTSRPSIEFPGDVAPLEPGARYAWTVGVDAVLGGRTESRRAFEVASEAAASAFRRAAQAVAGRAPEDLRDLLVAHWALRRDLLEEAERFARAHVERHPADRAGRETLLHVLRRQGTPEAEALR